MRVAVCWLVAPCVWIANELLVVPALTVTLAGTVATALLLESATDMSESGTAFRVTVPCGLSPALTVPALSVKLLSAGSATVIEC